MIEVRRSFEFAEWLFNLKDGRAKAKINTRLDRMEDGNVGDVSPVGEGVSEARIHYGPGYRLYFVTRGSELIILLCGGDKSTQARDITRAKQMAQEIRHARGN